MKKLLSCLLVFILAFSFATPAFAITSDEAVNTSEFNLVEYLKGNPVSTREEFDDILIEHGGRVEGFLDPYGGAGKESFSYEIDEENQLVYVTTVWCNELTPDISAFSAQADRVHRTHCTAESYILSGLVPVAEVSAEGWFRYDDSTFCEVSEPEGYFKPTLGSMWSGSAWIDSGNSTSKIAYVKVYGTATSPITMPIVGIPKQVGQFNYSYKFEVNQNGEGSAKLNLDWY